VIVRYFAAAKAAAGRGEDRVEADTLADALSAAQADRDDRFRQVLERCSFLVDGAPVGLRDHREVLLRPDSVVECLPPFAGG
jgi:molybdopterin converting factor small subunit